jgi:serine protease Do
MSRLAPRGRMAGLALIAAVCAAVVVATPAGAAATPTDRLKAAGQSAQPSVVLVHYSVNGYLNDNRDGKSHGPYSFGLWGTGFFVSSDGFIVTAGHVAALTNDQIKNDMVETYLLDDAKATGCEAAGNCQQLVDQYRSGYQLATSPTGLQSSIAVFTQDMNAVSQDTTGLPAELKTSSPVGQRDIAVLKVTGDSEPVLPLGDAAKVQAQDAISIIGYPGIANTGAQTSLVPTVTTGTVSARKQGSAELGLAPGVTIFQTDATVEHGNSGGPAVNEDGQVIGLVSFGASSTTNFLITSSDIQDLVRQAGANNGAGQIDRLWRGGLTYFAQQRYIRAKAAFEQCAALNRVQVGCADMTRKAAALVGQDEESKFAPAASFPTGLAILGLAVLVLLLGGLGAILMVVRRRGPSAPAPHPVTYPPRQPAYAAVPATYPAAPGAYPPPAPEWRPAPPTAPQPPGGPATSTPPAHAAGFDASSVLVAPPAADPAEVAERTFCSFCGNKMEAGEVTCVSCGHTRR